MRILIIGSKGFIGSHLLNFYKEKHEVWGCDVFTDYNEQNFFLVSPPNTDFQSIFSQHRFDACINCAGAASVPDSIKNPGRDFELNVHLVFLILEAIRIHNNTCRFINLSSAAVYGNPLSLPINEKQQLKPLSPYGFHKMQAEELCHEYHLFFQVPTCSIRIFSAYGPGLKKQILWDLFWKTKDKNRMELFGTGRESRDYIFIDDIVKGIDCVVKNGTFNSEAYNLSFGQAVRLQQLCEVFIKETGWKGDVIFSGQKREGDPDHWQADISKVRALGFSPTILIEEGIKKYIAWVRSLD